MTGQRSNHRGFTLIEVLVSLALMAMISAILIASLQIGGHTWQRVTRTAANGDDIAQAQELLRDHLGTLYPRTPSADRTGSGPLASDGQSIDFSSFGPDASQNGILRYRVAVSPKSGMLQVQSRLDRDERAGSLSPSWSTESLLPRVASLSVQFLLKSDGEPARWVDQWSEPTKLPQLIRIDLTFAASDSRQWPTLYVQPRVDTPATCEFDVVSRRCRSGT